MTTTYSAPSHPAEYSEDGATHYVTLETGESLIFRFNEMRRERTGIHGVVSIFLHKPDEPRPQRKNLLLAYDNFTLSRREGRNRLAADAYKALTSRSIVGATYSADDLRLTLDRLCIQAPQAWERQLVKISRADQGEPEPLTFALHPYILRGGGTIIFAPPGSGKSYILQTMAVSIASGCQTLWATEHSPVLYLNLERSARSLFLRERAIKRALNIAEPHYVDYVHARGRSLEQMKEGLQIYAQEHPGTVAVIDSLSRAGLADLTTNTSANAFVDLCNRLFETWIAIGHTPRASNENGGASRLYGSVHFDAGSDLLLRLSSQTSEGMIGLCLQVVKSNDTNKPAPQYLALEFGDANGPVTNIRPSKPTEFPELVSGSSQDNRADKIAEYLLNAGKSTANMVADALGSARTNISQTLKNDSRFIEVDRIGREIWYGVEQKYGKW